MLSLALILLRLFRSRLGVLFACLILISPSLWAQGNSNGNGNGGGNGYAYGHGNTSVSIPEVAIVSVAGNGSTTVAFGLDAPAEAGQGFQGDDQYDSSLWLNYTTLTGTSNPKKDVYVKISSGSVPDGFNLRVKALSDVGNGNGGMGNPVNGWISLTSSDQKIIQNIHTGYTGKGHQNGHQLIYNLQIDDLSSVDADDQASLEITYTIMD